jgi:diadenylate cyclase
MEFSLEQFLQPLDALRRPTWTTLVHWVDILIVAFLIYRLLMLIRGTRAARIVFGVASFVLLILISKKLGLTTLNWILDKAALLAPVALVILFLPELRQALETLGRVLPQKLGAPDPSIEVMEIEEIVGAVTELATARVGAIIVLERAGRLDSVIETGVGLDAKVSAPLLNAIFYEGNPLHDGAAIIRGDRLVAAACRLPLSESSRLDHHVHMRHRAAVGITETTDALVIVVSEERGTVSVALEGRLEKLASPLDVRGILRNDANKREVPNRLRLGRRRPAPPGKPATVVPAEAIALSDPPVAESEAS